MRITTGLSAVPEGTAITASCTVLYFALPSAATVSSTGLACARAAPAVGQTATNAATPHVNLLSESNRPIFSTLTFKTRRRNSLRRLRRVEAAPLLRGLDGDVLEAEGARVVQDLGRLDAAEGAVLKTYVVDDDAGEADHPHHARARTARHVFEPDVAHHGFVKPPVARVVEHVDGQHGLRHAPHLDAAHKDVLDSAAAYGVRLEAQRAVEVRAVHLAVFHEDVAAVARNLAPDDDAAVPVLHDAVAHDDVLRRDAHAPPVVVAARLDGDAVVARVEDAVFYQHVLGRLRVAPVVVRAVAVDVDAPHRDVCRERRVNLPEGRVDDAHAFDEDVAAAVRLYEGRAQVVTFAEDSLTDGNIAVPHLSKAFDVRGRGRWCRAATPRPRPPV